MNTKTQIIKINAEPLDIFKMDYNELNHKTAINKEHLDMYKVKFDTTVIGAKGTKLFINISSGTYINLDKPANDLKILSKKNGIKSTENFIGTHEYSFLKDLKFIGAILFKNDKVVTEEMLNNQSVYITISNKMPGYKGADATFKLTAAQFFVTLAQYKNKFVNKVNENVYEITLPV